MMNFLKQIFTWWNKQTFGTFLYTLFNGKFVGEDQFGNKYYLNSKGKRWVIYNNEVESTKIPPLWHSWIHFKSIKKPNDNKNNFFWQKEHEQNLTGTDKAHKPEGSLSLDKKKNMKKYESWNY